MESKKPKAHSFEFIYNTVQNFKAAWNWAAGNTRLEKLGIPFSQTEKEDIVLATGVFTGASFCSALIALMLDNYSAPAWIIATPVLGGIAALFPISSNLVSAYRAGQFVSRQQPGPAKQQPSPG